MKTDPAVTEAVNDLNTAAGLLLAIAAGTAKAWVATADRIAKEGLAADTAGDLVDARELLAFRV